MVWFRVQVKDLKNRTELNLAITKCITVLGPEKRKVGSALAHLGSSDARERLRASRLSPCMHVGQFLLMGSDRVYLYRIATVIRRAPK